MNKILVADDNVMSLLLIQDILDPYIKKGVEVYTAHTGRLAYDMACNHLPDLILLDVNMPEIDGYEVCRRLKENPNTQNITVIMVSINNQPEEIERAYRHGADDYVIKPYDIRLMFERVGKALPTAT